MPLYLDEFTPDLARGIDMARNSIIEAFLKYDDKRGAEIAREASIVPALESTKADKPDLTNGLEALTVMIVRLEDMIATGEDEMHPVHLDRALDQLMHFRTAFATVIGTDSSSDTFKRTMDAYRARVREAQS